MGPRCTYVGGGNTQIEKECIPWETIEKLYQLGHQLKPKSYPCGLSGIVVDPESGMMEGGAEPGRGYTRVAF